MTAVKSSKRLLRGALIGALVLAAGACTENDNELVENVGVTRLLLIHPDLQPQSLDGAEDTLQFAEWDVTTAVLEKEGPDVDLLIGEKCTVTDTAATSPTFDGACSAGVVAEATDEPVEIDLELVTTMRMARGRPLKLDVDGDTDDDGIPDDGDDSGDAFDNPCKEPDPVLGFVECDDNCTLIPNTDQANADLDGKGDVCTVSVVSSGVLLRVSDADGDEMPDAIDNCIWKSNPDQDFADPIGDECEQSAIVQIDQVPIPLDPDELLTIDGSNSFVVVDFGDTLDCIWPDDPDQVGEVGTCTLGTTKLCGRSSGSSALLGCD